MSEGMIAAFERARPGDQRERQRVAETSLSDGTTGLGAGSTTMFMGRTMRTSVVGGQHHSVFPAK